MFPNNRKISKTIFKVFPLNSKCLGFMFPSHGCNPADLALHLLTFVEAPDDAPLQSSDNETDAADVDTEDEDETRRRRTIYLILEGWRPHAERLAALEVARTNKKIRASPPNPQAVITW